LGAVNGCRTEFTAGGAREKNFHSHHAKMKVLKKRGSEAKTGEQNGEQNDFSK
jgi:hypothetical protein